MVKLYNSGSPVETGQIIAALEAEGIPVLKKDVGSNSYMTLTSGMSLMGSDLYVSESAEKRARDIISGIVGEAKSGTETDENKKLYRFSVIKRLAAAVLFILVMAGIVTGMFLLS